MYVIHHFMSSSHQANITFIRSTSPQARMNQRECEPFNKLPAPIIISLENFNIYFLNLKYLEWNWKGEDTFKLLNRVLQRFPGKGYFFDVSRMQCNRGATYHFVLDKNLFIMQVYLESKLNKEVQPEETKKLIQQIQNIGVAYMIHTQIHHLVLGKS